MQILGLLGMYFDAVVVKVETFLLLFRFALAILCKVDKRIIWFYSAQSRKNQTKKV